MGKAHSNGRPSLASLNPIVQLFLLAVFIMAVGLYYTKSSSASKPTAPQLQWINKDKTLLVSYAYFEKDIIQRHNMEYFLQVGLQPADDGRLIDYSFVVTGDTCGPCQSLKDSLQIQDIDLSDISVSETWSNNRISLLFRTDNVGMDLASHNVTLEYYIKLKKLWKYKFFLFINSSVMGPFMPAYMPPGWHWPDAYITRFNGNIHAVGSSLVCLPEVDAGGPGPRLESWAFMMDPIGLKQLIKDGVTRQRECKLCGDSDGIVVGGEYGITISMFKAGYNIATLLSKYQRDVPWADPAHWKCNNNAHPSRHGTYDSISVHPYEVVFVKSSWHVADPYTAKYSQWQLQMLAGLNTTGGYFNEELYRYGVSLEAQESKQLESCYAVKLKPVVKQ